MKAKRTALRLLTIAAALLLGTAAHAQRISIETNLPTWANLGTMNLGGEIALAQHWSIEGAVKWNPWTFREGEDNQFQERCLTPHFGVRWWRWHCFSGWYMGAKGIYSLYNTANIITDDCYEGWCAALGLTGGYLYMIDKSWNITFGGGICGGYHDTTFFEAARCGRIKERRKGPFASLCDITVSISYVLR